MPNQTPRPGMPSPPTSSRKTSRLFVAYAVALAVVVFVLAVNFVVDVNTAFHDRMVACYKAGGELLFTDDAGHWSRADQLFYHEECRKP